MDPVVLLALLIAAFCAGALVGGAAERAAQRTAHRYNVLDARAQAALKRMSQPERKCSPMWFDEGSFDK